MIHFWRFHWLWCCCVLHSNLLVAGDKETVPLYKKMLSDTNRESLKFSDPKYSTILRGITTDARRTGTDIVKKSNDHLEKQTAPNRLSRDSQSSETNHTEELDHPKIVDDLSNASRNARDLSYDTIVNDTALVDTNNTAGIALKNDSFYSIATDTPDVSVTTSLNSSSDASKKTATMSVMLKNPKDNENKTKIDSNSYKKATVNIKVSKNSTTETIEKPKISNVLLLNDTRDNSTDYISDQWNLNDTSHNYNVTDDTSKNVTVLTSLADEEAKNETTVSATSRRTMPESPPLSTLNIALITVAAFAVVSTVSIIGMVSVVLYRRYHWNKPQTLSDKCSNADSTGYIDDSTLKENSEEMYSLDNDSFLNSLEAMTIQNYWADSIRHTKL